MKKLIVASAGLALLSGIALAAPAEAGYLTSRERAALARDSAHVHALKRHARSDGHVSLWERIRIRVAESRHHALVKRYRNN